MLLFALIKLIRMLKLRKIIGFLGFRNTMRVIRFVSIRRIIKGIVFGFMVLRFGMMLMDAGKTYYGVGRERLDPYVKKARGEIENRGWDKYLDADYYRDLMAGTCEDGELLDQ